MPGITRRQMMIGLGAGGAILAGGAGALNVLRPGDHHRPDVSPSPPDASIANGTLESRHMRRTLGWTMSIPTAGAKATVFCLHGYHNDHHFPFDSIHLPAVVDSLNMPLAVAAVDGGADSYWHPRADGTDALGMLMDEFIPLVEQRTHTSRRALLGWSMGGYGSLLAAEQAPGHFFAVAAASPALWTSSGRTAPGAFDGATDYQRWNVFSGEDRLAALTVRVDCGTSDPFYDATQRFVTALPPGHQGGFGPGGHDAGYWRSIASTQIATIAGAERKS